MLVEKGPWDAVLEGEGPQEGWTCFKKETLNMLKEAIPTCQKTSWQGRPSALLNRELWLEFRNKSVSSLEEVPGNSGGLQGHFEVMQGEN